MPETSGLHGFVHRCESLLPPAVRAEGFAPVGGTGQEEPLADLSIELRFGQPPECESAEDACSFRDRVHGVSCTHLVYQEAVEPPGENEFCSAPSTDSLNNANFMKAMQGLL